MVKENAKKEERYIEKNGRKGVMYKDMRRITFPETPNLCIS